VERTAVHVRVRGDTASHPHFDVSFDVRGSGVTEQFCRCGRQLIRTVERGASADRATGEFPMEVYHSCPKWFVPQWLVFITLGAISGAGHDSYGEDDPFPRRWG
jgi:hypothetical protein